MSDQLRDRDAAQREALLSGDPVAFERFVRQHQDRVFRIALRWLRSVEEAHDLTQDVFLTLSLKLSQFQGNAQLSTWVYRVAVNHAKNRLRYLSRRRQRAHESWEDRYSQPGDERLPAALPGPHELLMAQELAEGIEGALASLSPMHRQVVLWRDIEGLSYEAIAARLGLPTGTVKSRIHRARGQLHAALEVRGISPLNGAAASRRRDDTHGSRGGPR